MKRAIVAFLAIVVVALAIVAGTRMTPDAMAVVVGIVCGIGASIPTSLVMLLLMRRRDEAQAEPPRAVPQMPTVMIVNPAGGNVAPYQLPGNQYMPPAYGTAMPRQFQVVGADSQDDQPFFGM